MAELDYYLYISHSKLDMLAQQMPDPVKRKIKAEIDLNFPMVAGRISIEQDYEIKKLSLKIISKHIIEEHHPGRLEDAREWTYDKLCVKHIFIKKNPDVFLLIGFRDNSYHCLGGSAHHIIGNRRGDLADSNYSYFPYMVETLTSALSEDGIAVLKAREQLFGKPSDDFLGVRPHEWADVIEHLYKDSSFPAFNVSFLSRFLAYGRSLNGHSCTFSSPLSVTKL